MGLIGHNKGPTMEGGEAWRRHCWGAARAALLPTLPVEVVRLRVARARELGLDYRTYASVRAATGHDLVAFLFSSNALRIGPLSPALPGPRADRLAALRGVERVALTAAPLSPGMALAANPGTLDRAEAAPAALAPFGLARARLRAVLGAVPADRVLLVGDHGLEADWAAAARLAGYLPAARYFASA
jgi:hypothetical protein